MIARSNSGLQKLSVSYLNFKIRSAVLCRFKDERVGSKMAAQRKAFRDSWGSARIVRRPSNAHPI